MYHIKPDKRSIMSLELIRKGFYELLKEEDYEILTVTQIAKRAGVGRATFYRLFDEKRDILLYDLDQMMLQLEERLRLYFNQHTMITELELICYNMEHFFANIDLLRHLDAAHCLGLVVDKTRSIVVRRWGFLLRDRYDLDDLEWEYFTQFRSAILSSVLKVAVRRYPKDSAERIIQVLSNLFSNQTFSAAMLNKQRSDGLGESW